MALKATDFCEGKSTLECDNRGGIRNEIEGMTNSQSLDGTYRYEGPNIITESQPKNLDP